MPTSVRVIARRCLKLSNELSVRGDLFARTSEPPLSLIAALRAITKSRCELPEPLARGRYHVGRRRLQVEADSAPGPIDALVYYPGVEDGENVPFESGPEGPPFPLIAYGHGNRTFAICPGTPTGLNDYEQLSTILGHLASWGYVVISTDLSTTVLEPFKTEVIEASIARMQVENADPASPFADRLRLDDLVVMGHSTGAGAGLAAQRFEAAALGLITPSTQTALSVRAAAPIFIIEASEEGEAGTSPATVRRIFDNATGAKYLMRIQGANHFGFTDQLCVEQDPPATIARADQQRIAFAYLTAFLQRHLRGAREFDVLLAGDLTIPGLEGFGVSIESDT